MNQYQSHTEGLCKCGCGIKTEIALFTRKERGWQKGKHKNYIKGHHSRKNWVGLINMTFGQLIIEDILMRNIKSKTICLARCKCGIVKEYELYNITSGHTQSCGCKKKGNVVHGMFGTRFYRIFRGILRRCNNPKDVGYRKYYGAKGIKCNWISFDSFKKDMYKSYQDHVCKYGEVNTTIDRIDGKKGYSKGNCRWATCQQQAINRRPRNSNNLFKNKDE